MRLALLGMHRSGINTVGKWLLRQSSLKDESLVVVDGGWHEFYLTDKYINNFSFMSQVNHPDHEDWPRLIQNHSVVTVENEGLRYFGDFCHENGYTWGKSIVVIRDFRNWLASTYKMNGPVSESDVLKYRTHLDALINNELWLYPINYSLWYLSAKYRQKICKDFNLSFTDCGFKDVPTNPLQRYKLFNGDKIFKTMLEHFKNIVELSDYWLFNLKGIE